MVSQCQTIKKLWAGHESAQTDGQMDRQSDFYIPPWTSFAGGITTVYFENTKDENYHILCKTISIYSSNHSLYNVNQCDSYIHSNFNHKIIDLKYKYTRTSYQIPTGILIKRNGSKHSSSKLTVIHAQIQGFEKIFHSSHILKSTLTQLVCKLW